MTIQQFLIVLNSLVNSSNHKVRIPDSVQEELRWWHANLRDNNGRCLIVSDPDLVIYADASNSSWGAFCNGVGTGGPWSSLESLLHINCKELTAACYALQSFVKDSGLSVELRLDNQSAVSYINKCGGTHSRSLSSIAKELLFWCEQKRISVHAVHLPGVSNTAADYESRRSQGCAEWRLCPSVFQSISDIWNIDIDLFASEWNHQVSCFVSWNPQPTAWAVDAFSLSWSGLKAYVFPPFKLIGRCLSKTRKDDATITLISPFWPGQFWFPTALEMSIDIPRLLTPRIDLLTSSQGVGHPLFRAGAHHLIAWRLSGNVRLTKEFRKKLSDFCFKEFVPIRGTAISQPGALGLAGVSHGTRIPLNAI